MKLRFGVYLGRPPDASADLLRRRYGLVRRVSKGTVEIKAWTFRAMCYFVGAVVCGFRWGLASKDVSFRASRLGGAPFQILDLKLGRWPSDFAGA